MSYGQTQPRPGHLSGRNANPKGQSNPRVNVAAQAARKGTSPATSDHYPDAKSTNNARRGTRNSEGQNQRGYAHNPAAGQSTRNTSAGRVRRIGGNR